MMEFSKEKVVDGVIQRDFAVAVDGETVPCAIWSPQDAKGPRPLIAMGHGGSQHKKALGIRRRAVDYANKHGWATLAIDCPGHGDRISREEALTLMREVGARVRGESGATPFDAERMKMMTRRSAQAVPEWQAALDAAQSLDFVGNTEPVAYWGVSMGTAIGVPLLAAEPRFCCAVLGLAGLRAKAVEFEAAANSITIPVQFVFQWDDAVAPRDGGIALFNAFGSKEKTMHINPGAHVDIPTFESTAWEHFFLRHVAAASS
jgi:pimeloyl-ACP methyl ester carboxylesterase